MTSIKHANTVTTPDPTQAELDEQIALGNYPVGTTLNDIAKQSDWNADHIIDTTGASNGDVLTVVAGVAEWATASGGGAVDSVNGQTGVVVLDTGDIATVTNKNYVTDAQLTVLGNTSGTNTGDQTTIVGITGTKAQFDTALTDGNFLYVGDVAPAGSDQQVQFNNAGAFGADSNFVWDNSNKRLGIGETAPDSLLHTKGVAGTGIKIESTGAYSIIDMLTDSGQSYIVPSQDTLNFYTGSIGSPTNKVTILGNGNVGIGTLSPTLLFQVASRGGMGSDGVFWWGNALTGNSRGNLSWDTDCARIITPVTLKFEAVNYEVFGTFRPYNNSAAAVTIVIAGAPSQTASLTEWRNSSGTVQLAIAENGRDFILDTTTGTKIGTATTQKLGFWNATPVVQSTGWAATNVTTDKAFDANATTIDELADVLGTLIEQLKTMGLLGA